ncbi:MAG: 4-alpha-glucanotransferase [Saprospiraceae bacterium]
MTICFQIEYHTQWGDQLAICGEGSELGNKDIQKAMVMEYRGEGIWQAFLALHKVPVSLTYQYVLVSGNGERKEEGGAPRQVRIPRHADRLLLRDAWRPGEHPDQVFQTAAFRDVFFKQENVWKAGLEPGKQSVGHRFQFRLCAARIPQGMQFVLLGNLPELGAWNTAAPLLLSNAAFPHWTIDVVLPSLEAFEYKYGLYDPEHKRWLDYEGGPNRSWKPSPGSAKPDSIVLSDEFYRHTLTPWKGAGVAVPVFSLRSSQSLGVGEFRDLEKMADWARKTGLKVLQILPVNDTSVGYTWTDSYPYSAISVFALHPLYLALDAIPGAEQILGKKPIETERQRLNAGETVDYDAVIRLKLDWSRKIYDVQAPEFLSSSPFQEFFEANRHWLEPYAVFCYLRDKYGTADFSAWGEHAVYSPALLRQLADPAAPEYRDIAFFYFQQFYLDQQLFQAANYARKLGVVLKGDLPIGIYRHSVDAWVAPSLYNMSGQAGAPPDPFSDNGQNWGFPTYNWEEMAKDNYLWWRQRMQALSRYFDAYRIDHILGFFRIWEIPVAQVEGMMGRFRPAIPVRREEFAARGIFFDAERFCRPYITWAMLEGLFDSDAEWVKQTFFEEVTYHSYAFKAGLDTQRKVEAFFEQPQYAERAALKPLLFRLFAEVLFFEEPGSEGQAFHPRIDFPATRSFQVLAPEQQERLRALHHDYFYQRQEVFWRTEAMKKLPALKKATNMLICGEDLGMVPACVPGVMRELGILSLEIQRMSKNPATEFLKEGDIPYLSVTSPSTHDMSPIRAWWEESSREQIRRFYQEELRHIGEPPFYCEPFVAQAILRQHFKWHNILTVIPLQDLLAMSGPLRRENPYEERINVPANPKHYWRYRMHLSVEALLEAEEFNTLLLEMLRASGRA